MDRVTLEIKHLIKKYMPAQVAVPVALIWLMQLGAYYLPKLINDALDRGYLDMSSEADALVPLVPASVIIYVAAYAFWGVSFYVICRSGRRRAARLVMAQALACLVCGIVFLLIPTAVERPAVTDSSLAAGLLRLIYEADTPVNLFPSMHCTASWLCWAGIRDDGRCPARVKAGQLIFALAVCASTVLTKQHVLADILPGIVLAEICWRTAPELVPGVRRIYELVR